MTIEISRFTVPRREDLPDDLKARIAEVEEKSGFVPNVFLALAHRPDGVAGVLRLPRRADGQGDAGADARPTAS